MTPNECWEIAQITAPGLYGSFFMDAFVVKSRVEFKSLFVTSSSSIPSAFHGLNGT
jgi:hypothetical protein